MSRDSYPYTAYYCEENIWHLCQQEDFRSFDKKVVLISNEARTCALWNQRASTASNVPIIWDYHVVMLFNSGSWQVYDLDTLLDAPTPVADYVWSTFGQAQVPEQFQPVFRVIDADEFAANFSSDRSHMLTADGQWQIPPPLWPAIVRNGQSNLMELVDMQKPSLGTVMDLTQFQIFFSPEK